LALARLHHELGTRTGDPAHLETARLLFGQMWHSHGSHEAADASCASAARAL